jgi:uncharacterized membrane protein YccC
MRFDGARNILRIGLPPEPDTLLSFMRKWFANSAAWLAQPQAWAQALRVMVACLVSYGLSLLLNLEHGYWAVFTALIVMQSSVGATLGAATDRLAGTIAGAALGGLAVLITPARPVEIGISLVLVVGVAGYAAARTPRLKNAGLTAAIVILTRRPEVPVDSFVLQRVLEITLGGVVGVAASRFVLPNRSRSVLFNRLAAVLKTMADMLNRQADALERGGEPPTTEASIALRKALVAAEALLADAQRERAMLLSRNDVSEALPRALWRVRNDMTHIGRFLDEPFPSIVAERLGQPAAELLRAFAAFALGAAEALTQGTAIPAEADEAASAAFEAAFAAFSQSPEARAMPFEDIGRCFGLAFALRRTRQDLHDFGDRIADTQTSG